MDAKIRRASVSDCAALLDLIRQHAAFERSVATIDTAELRHILTAPQAPMQIFVGVDAGIILGYAAFAIDYSLWRGGPWAHLDCLFVVEQARGQNLGAALFRHVRKAARVLGADRLEWQTPNWNARAIAFYRREGADCVPKTRFSITP